jgi:hypothetical protein
MKLAIAEITPFARHEACMVVSYHCACACRIESCV